MIGWMTEKQAKQNGFTHHGSYYGIPLWMSDDDQQPMVATKHFLLEPLLDIAHFIEQLLFPFVHGADAEPCFMFTQGEPIK